MSALGQRAIKFKTALVSKTKRTWQADSLSKLNKIPAETIVQIQVVLTDNGLSDESEKRRIRISKLKVRPYYLFAHYDKDAHILTLVKIQEERKFNRSGQGCIDY